MYINFLAQEVNITRMRISKLGRRGPGSDRVLCKSTDVTKGHIRLSCRAFTMIVYLSTFVYEVDQWLSGRISVLWSLFRENHGIVYTMNEIL